MEQQFDCWASLPLQPFDDIAIPPSTSVNANICVCVCVSGEDNLKCQYKSTGVQAGMFTCQIWHILETIFYQYWHILACQFWN